MKPAVSVVIPVYNTEKFLRRCLDSVCRQSLTEIEVICVDDCSSDGSAAVLAEYAARDPRVKVITFAENRGAAAARNAGIDAATGDYLGFVDSDDFPDADFYEKLHEIAIRENADIAKGNYRYSNGAILYFQNEQIRIDPKVFSFAYCSAIFKRRLIEDNKIRFPILCDMEDPVFTYRAALASNRTIVVDGAYVNITIRPESQTRANLTRTRLQDRLKGMSLLVDLAVKAQHSGSFVVAFWLLQTFVNSYAGCDCELRQMLVDGLFALARRMPNAESVFHILHSMRPAFAHFLETEDHAACMDFERKSSIFNIRRRMKTSPKVSVVIPVYNAEHYIGRCLNSICLQTLQEIEIICVNDASTDESLLVLKDYAFYFPNVKIVNREVNGGESAARNDGIRIAKGEFLSFVDNDDWIDEDFLERQYSAAKREGADIAKADVRVVGYDGVERSPGWGGINKRIAATGDKFFFSLYWWTGIYRRSLITENSIAFPEGMPLGGDIVFLNSVVRCANRVAVVDGTFYHWIRREGSGDSQTLSHEKIISVACAYKTVLQGINGAFQDQKTTESYFFIYGMFLSGFIDAAMKTQCPKDKSMLAEALYSSFLECRDVVRLMKTYTTGLTELDSALKNKDCRRVKNIIEGAVQMKMRAEALRRQIKRKAV